MRYVFAILLGLHGLIHLMGFAFALFDTNINKQVLGISKPIGAFWLLTFILFVVSAVQYFGQKKWFFIAAISIILSQILIITAWKEAKYGSIANILFFLVAIFDYGQYQFQNKVDKEVSTFLQNTSAPSIYKANEQRLKQLPDIVRKWLKNSGALNGDRSFTVHLEQEGKMRTKPNGKWMPFEATQYFDVENASFIWQTKVKSSFGFSLLGRDKLINGKGEMLIKIAGIVPVVDEKNNHKINSGAMIRYLSEICWFPSAALSNYITWEAIDSKSAKAVFKVSGQSVSGTFNFNDDGEMTSFESKRYFGGNQKAALERWLVEVEDHDTFKGIIVPSQCKVTWKLKEDDFEWLRLNITDLHYN